MTDTRHQVTRRTILPEALTRRKLAVTIGPGDVISFREHGRRRTYLAPLGRVFLTVARWVNETERLQKINERRKAKGVRMPTLRVKRGKL